MTMKTLAIISAFAILSIWCLELQHTVTALGEFVEAQSIFNHEVTQTLKVQSCK